MGEPITGPQALKLSDAERIKRLERIVDAARREGSDDTEVVAIVREFMKQPQNGTANKVWWLVGAFGVCGLIGSYLAVETISHGKEIATLKAEIASCLKKP
jgi:hypothetical protein